MAAFSDYRSNISERNYDSDAVGRFACLPVCPARLGMCGVHAALTREDEVGSRDDARARGLLFVLVLGGVGLLLAGEPHCAAPPSQSPAAGSRGLRWPRRDVSGYWQRRCLFAHWLSRFKVCAGLQNQSVRGTRVRRREQRGEGREMRWLKGG